MKKIMIFCLVFVFTVITLNGQTGSIEGVIKASGTPAEYAQIVIDQTDLGAVTNLNGQFSIKDVPFGTYQVTISSIGYKESKKEISITSKLPVLNLDFELTEQSLLIEDIVVTATKTPRRQTSSPVIVNVVNSQTLDNVQACNLSEGLKFQPGLRVETDCQTCNYTQLRMNGCLLYTSPSPRDQRGSRMPSSA